MKKHFLSVLFLVGFIVSVQAQFYSQGAIIGNGSFRFFSSGNGSEVSITPSAAYLVIDNLAVGGQADISSSVSKSGGSKYSSSSLSIGPWVRYYLDMGAFAELSADLGTSKSKVTVDPVSTITKYGLSDFFGGIGYAVRLSDKVSFDPVLGYFSSTTKNKDTKDKSTLSGVLLKAGFTVKLN